MKYHVGIGNYFKVDSDLVVYLLLFIYLFFAPITVIHLFVCVYECYNNVHDNSEQELSGNPNGLISGLVVRLACPCQSKRQCDWVLNCPIGLWTNQIRGNCNFYDYLITSLFSDADSVQVQWFIVTYARSISSCSTSFMRLSSVDFSSCDLSLSSLNLFCKK